MMELWEIDLRAKLDAELDEGFYQIGDGITSKWVAWTGKQGYINYKVEKQKIWRREYEAAKYELGDSDDPIIKQMLEIMKSMLDNGR